MTFEEKYAVLGSNNPGYDGMYYTAVKTTGIFCMPSCRARTPKEKNVVFYNTAQQALENGFRPCKICKPMQRVGSTPAVILKLISDIEQSPHQKITDKMLEDRGLEPYTIRRYFKKEYDMTFHKYQRMLRMNDAFSSLKKGKSIAMSAHESGYESLSGFNESYQAVFGASIRNTKDKSIVNVLRFNTVIGSMIACASEQGICFLGFVGQKNIESHFTSIQKTMNAVILPGKNRFLKEVEREINEYYEGDRMSFSVALDIIGTDFQRQVWAQLMKIPYGKTVSYKDQAIAINKPNATRAVATANGANKISIIIPCHRVIGSNGSLTGYAGGIHKKSWLLNFEKEKNGAAQQMKLDL